MTTKHLWLILLSVGWFFTASFAFAEPTYLSTSPSQPDKAKERVPLPMTKKSIKDQKKKEKKEKLKRKAKLAPEPGSSSDSKLKSPPRSQLPGHD